MNIDWTKLITKAMKDQLSKEQHLASVAAETTFRRTMADTAIAPLQDAVDIDDATDAELALLKIWKKYRLALNRLPEQVGYPDSIDWPTIPA